MAVCTLTFTALWKYIYNAVMEILYSWKKYTYMWFQPTSQLPVKHLLWSKQLGKIWPTFKPKQLKHQTLWLPHTHITHIYHILVLLLHAYLWAGKIHLQFVSLQAQQNIYTDLWNTLHDLQVFSKLRKRENELIKCINLFPHPNTARFSIKAIKGP